ncbi:chlorohydrolase family protein [Leekyejoonella antrihumi]|uniref:Amidohydrolase family protein n=1 Tax=Leekyejoonella antrihumi TaxID=1660198 RepID=A0A563DY83_9MICO|nr:chlorohydrolase family protein [Leekyejoonella antrihumi]TWP35165.1 amidohydrolase family protein [Leekyejoonella antrihumi]
MRSRVAARYVLAHIDGHHALLTDGEVVWEGDRLIFVGRSFPGPVDEHFDLGESLVLPGFIDLDALTDIDHLMLDSWQGDSLADGLVWSREYAARARQVFSARERLAIRDYALAQLALHGVTTYMPIASEVHSEWAESFDDLIAMAEASRRVGLRGYLGPSYRSGVNVVDDNGTRDIYRDPSRGQAGLRDAIRFLDWCATQADPLVNGVLLPCRIETLDADLMRATAQVSAERGALVRLHAMQGRLERELITRWHGMTPLDLIEHTGLLNDRLLVPHAIFTDQSSLLPDVEPGHDVSRLAAAGVSVIHCPLTSFRYGNVLESFGRYRAAGVNLALGTDSFPPDLVRGMDIGVHLAKWVDGRRDAAPAEHYLDAATLGGAAALKRDDLGRLEPGAQADLIALSLNDIRDGALDDPIRTLLLSGTARQVTHSVVAGRTVVRDGALPGIDTNALRAQGQELFARMRAAYPSRDVRHRSEAELFPSTFPAFPLQQDRELASVERRLR